MTNLILTLNLNDLNMHLVYFRCIYDLPCLKKMYDLPIILNCVVPSIILISLKEKKIEFIFIFNVFCQKQKYT